MGSNNTATARADGAFAKAAFGSNLTATARGEASRAVAVEVANNTAIASGDDSTAIAGFGSNNTANASGDGSGAVAGGNGNGNTANASGDGSFPFVVAEVEIDRFVVAGYPNMYGMLGSGEPRLAVHDAESVPYRLRPRRLTLELVETSLEVAAESPMPERRSLTVIGNGEGRVGRAVVIVEELDVVDEPEQLLPLRRTLLLGRRLCGVVLGGLPVMGVGIGARSSLPFEVPEAGLRCHIAKVETRNAGEDLLGKLALIPGLCLAEIRA